MRHNGYILKQADVTENVLANLFQQFKVTLKRNSKKWPQTGWLPLNWIKWLKVTTVNEFRDYLEQLKVDLSKDSKWLPFNGLR